jgi:hypothetical protein
MKKTLLILAAVAMLMVGLAGQALAYFAEGDLIQVVYNTGGTKEVMTDLGTGLNYTTANSTDTKITANPFSLSELGASDWSQVNVAYFTITTQGGVNNLWLSGPSGTQNITSIGKWNSGAGSAAETLIQGNALTGKSQNINNQTDTYSYVNLFDGANVGTFMKEISAGTVEASLASFSTGSTYVDQYLYYYATPNAKSTGLQVATIRTYADGTTEINPSAVPVPAAIYLLGSGLLALVGIRRKTNLDA